MLPSGAGGIPLILSKLLRLLLYRKVAHFWQMRFRLCFLCLLLFRFFGCGLPRCAFAPWPFAFHSLTPSLNVFSTMGTICIYRVRWKLLWHSLLHFKRRKGF